MIERFGSIAAWAVAVGFLLAVAAGCTQSEKAETPKQGADSIAALRDTTLRRNLPPGRFHVPTRHTPVPDFFISLPEGYMVKNLSRLPNDEYFVVRTDDPSLKDSAAVTPGFMLLYVGVKPQGSLPESGKFTTRVVKLGTTDVEWKEWADTLPDRSLYHIHDISSSDYFRTALPELAKAPLNLHIYVAGKDTARVAELVRAVESLSFTP